VGVVRPSPKLSNGSKDCWAGGGGGDSFTSTAWVPAATDVDELMNPKADPLEAATDARSCSLAVVIVVAMADVSLTLTSPKSPPPPVGTEAEGAVDGVGATSRSDTSTASDWLVEGRDTDADVGAVELTFIPPNKELVPASGGGGGALVGGGAGGAARGGPVG